MRVVSMVPSWTETLIKAGVEVVGRTRFCIHPSEKIKSIPVVGGTKDINWEKLNSLDYDFLILDKEENLKAMSDAAKGGVVATHVKNVRDVASELHNLAEKLKNNNLHSIADRWQAVIEKLKAEQATGLTQLHELSKEQQKRLGIQEWIKIPEQPYGQLVYVIWKNPYMAITAETFVGSMLDLVGLPTSISAKDFGKSYPEILLENFDKSKTLFLFSSEPFPFHKKISELKQLSLHSALVDGEAYSWFGTRALNFLENQLK